MSARIQSHHNPEAHTMRSSNHLLLLLPALAATAAIFGSGCIAIPMGTETFTTTGRQPTVLRCVELKMPELGISDWKRVAKARRRARARGARASYVRKKRRHSPAR